MRDATIAAPIATLWSDPQAPRPGIDAAALGLRSDPGRWVAGLDDAGRMYTGVLTQLWYGEPVLVEEVRDGWAKVVATAQPAAKLDPRGYPGWLPLDQLDPVQANPRPQPPTVVDPAAALAIARQWLGVPYVWGGMTPFGIDCSGLVHLALRRIGVTLPRDADDQATATVALEPGEERPGDLYFFARAGSAVHHVGFVSAEPDRDGVLHMLHACGEVGMVWEGPMTESRRSTYIAAHRIG